jgi:signal transduction histidine kinase
VEDNQVVRQLAEEMLTSLGCRVETARDGSEALHCWEGKRYDLLLMDCQMQGMDGFAATRRIRELEQAAGNGEHCPIVALTAFSTANDMALCRDAGMDDYLRKPFNRRELAALLERCTTGECRGFSPPPPPTADDAAPRPAESGAVAPAMTFREYARRLVENEEGLRKRLATELHDEIGRAMATLSLTLGMIDASLPENSRSSFLAERVDDAQKLIESASRTVGNIMFGLRPSVLDDFGLVSTIRRHAVLFEKKTGVAVDLEGVDETCGRLLPPQELAMYRVYQEAMLNASLHGAPSCITVTIRCADNRTMLQISDDGCGFDPLHPPPSVAGRGWGLMLMRERIEAVGGTFQLASHPGEGTIITVTIEESV